MPPDAPLALIPAEILDQFVRQGPLSPEQLDAAVRRFKRAIIERALGGELTHHLGYALGGAKPGETTNHRHGTSGKTVLTDDGPLVLDIPRDRAGTLEPRLIRKHERRFTGFDDKVIALYARGLTVREIQAFLSDMYGVNVSPAENAGMPRPLDHGDRWVEGHERSARGRLSRDDAADLHRPICCATVWTLRIGKSASRWRRRSVRSTPRPARMRRS